MSFDVDDNEKSAFPFDILGKAPGLQSVGIGKCSNVEMFQPQNSSNSKQEILGQLKKLILYDVSKLISIGLEESVLNTAYEKLHELNVFCCDDMTKLFHFPSEVSFSCLKILLVHYCSRLEYLFTSSMAIELKQLEKITVNCCESITKIVENEQEGITSQGIKFERLYWIELGSLSNLECFYSGNDTLQLPSLIQVEIWECPKMEVFSGGEIIANSFRGIQTSFNSHDELVFHNDVKDSVKRVFLLQVGTSTQSINYEFKFCMNFMSSKYWVYNTSPNNHESNILLIFYGNICFYHYCYSLIDLVHRFTQN